MWTVLDNSINITYFMNKKISLLNKLTKASNFYEGSFFIYPIFQLFTFLAYINANKWLASYFSRCINWVYFVDNLALSGISDLVSFTVTMQTIQNVVLISSAVQCQTEVDFCAWYKWKDFYLCQAQKVILSLNSCFLADTMYEKNDYFSVYTQL